MKPFEGCLAWLARFPSSFITRRFNASSLTGSSLAVLACIAGIHALSAAPCVDYGNLSFPLSRIRTADEMYSVDISGNRAYVAEVDSGLQVFDISDPTSPRAQSRLSIPGNPYGVASMDRYAYVAAGSAGLQVVDVSNPSSPVLVGSSTFPGLSMSVVTGMIHGFVPVAYVGTLDRGLQFIDVYDPSRPHWVGSMATRGPAWDLELAGTHLYIADSQGLTILDLANPYAPAVAGSLDLPGYATSVALSGQYAYVADGWSGGLQIIDASDPRAPTVAGQFVSGNPETVGVFNHVAVLGGTDWWGTQLVDVSDPRAPRAILTMNSGIVSSVAVAPDLVCVGIRWPPFIESKQDFANARGARFSARKPSGDAARRFGGELQILHIGTQGGLAPLAHLPSPAVDVEIDGTRAYVPTLTPGLQIIDVTDPTLPVVLGAADTPGQARAVALSGAHAFVADGLGGLQIVEVSNPTAPVVVGSLGTPGYADEIAVRGGIACVTFRAGDQLGSGMQTIDVSDVRAPRALHTLFPPGEAGGVTIAGNYAYLGGDAFWVIDESNPTTPRIVGSVDTPGFGLDVTVHGTLAYVADAGAGLAIVDVSNPTDPRLLGRAETPGVASEVALDGHYAYVADSDGGVHLFDVSNAAAPIHVGAFTDDPFGLAVGNGHLCTVDGGFHIYPLHCSETTPVLVSDFEATWDGGIGIRVSWRQTSLDPFEFVLWRASGDEAPSRIDISAAPHDRGFWELVDLDVSAGATYTYVLMGNAPGQAATRLGSVVVTAAGLQAGLLRAIPNPAHGRTMLHFDLVRSCDVRLQIFDAAGRRVRQILWGRMQPGRHAAAWDGRDERGRSVANGIYLARLGGTGNTATTRLLFLR